jgi:hypothetical protein
LYCGFHTFPVTKYQKATIISDLKKNLIKMPRKKDNPENYFSKKTQLLALRPEINIKY